MNKIVAIQGNHPSELNPKSDTSAFLAVEAQNRKFKIFYYEPKDLSIINDKVLAKGTYIQFNYSNKKFFNLFVVGSSFFFSSEQKFFMLYTNKQWIIFFCTFIKIIY